MESKILSKWSPIILGFAGIVFFAAIIFAAISFWKSDIKPSSHSGDQTIQDLGKANLKLPTRLEIPKINIDAAIEDVGLTPQGTMAVPEGPLDVAWFDLGPRPGQTGSAVIAGHEGWKDGVRAVFDDLYQLRAGDKLYVKDREGMTTTFVVRSMRTYNQNEDASDIFSSSDGKAHLNLITCEGIWNAAQKSYSGRLVIFADKETE
jgi:LPXTG-site transpeptidase (sortase) family protein